MKKTLALILVLAAILSLTIPLIVAAESPPATPGALFLELVEPEPVIDEATPVPTETDPGGAPIDFTQLFQALITLLASWITLRLIPWLKARTTERQYMMLTDLVAVGVRAAENMFKSGEGTKKFNYVMEFLKRKGVNVDEAEIEAMVYNLFNQFKKA